MKKYFTIDLLKLMIFFHSDSVVLELVNTSSSSNNKTNPDM